MIAGVVALASGAFLLIMLLITLTYATSAHTFANCGEVKEASCVEMTPPG